MKNNNDNNKENEMKYKKIIKPKNIIKKGFISFRSYNPMDEASFKPNLLKNNSIYKNKTFIIADSLKYNDNSTKINTIKLTNSSNFIKSKDESLKSLELSSKDKVISEKKILNLKTILKPIKNSVENDDNPGLKRFLLSKFKLAGKSNYKNYFTSHFEKYNHKLNKRYFSPMDIQRYNDYIKFKYVKKNLFKNEKDESLSDMSLDVNKSQKQFLKNKNGIYLLSNTCRPNFNSYRKTFFQKQLNKYNYKKRKNSHLNIFNYFEKIKNRINLENKEMKKNIKHVFSELDILKNNIDSKTSSLEELFYLYNKKRGAKEKIITNRILGQKDENYIIVKMKNLENEKLKKKKFNIINSNNIAYIAQKKVNTLFHDLLTFQLPKLSDKKYIRKVLYDIFIEFKNLLVLSMMKNKDINIYKKGIDFDTFYNCNTKINQQGKIIAKKIFDIFNNKTDTKYMNLNHYINGMIKIKGLNKENRLDLFFEMLNNDDGCLTYDDIYKLSIICLQKITLNIEDEADFEKYQKENDNKDIKIVEGLAEYFCKMIFKLVNIDIKDKIPLKLLKKMIIQGGEQADYIELLFGSSNFT